MAEFSAAQRQEADVQACALRGHVVSARDQYLVACNSYRAVEYYCGGGSGNHIGADTTRLHQTGAVIHLQLKSASSA